MTAWSIPGGHAVTFAELFGRQRGPWCCPDEPPGRLQAPSHKPVAIGHWLGWQKLRAVAVQLQQGCRKHFNPRRLLLCFLHNG